MKKTIFFLIVVLMFSMTSYAGQWQRNDQGYWYQNDDGSYKTGWHQDIDGKWYYLDDQSGYMLTNTVTPDGYYLSETGEWIEEGTNMVDINSEQYDNESEVIVTAYSPGPHLVEQYDTPLPVIVKYNNEYKNVYGGQIKVSGVEVSKDGFLFIKLHFDKKDSMTFLLNARCRYNFEDGTFIDSDEEIFDFSRNGVDNAFSEMLLWSGTPKSSDNGSKLSSIEICIEEGKNETK